MRPERLCGWPVLTLVWWICCADDTMFMRASDIVDEGAQGGSGRGYYSYAHSWFLTMAHFDLFRIRI